MFRDRINGVRGSASNNVASIGMNGGRVVDMIDGVTALPTPACLFTSLAAVAYRLASCL